MANIRCVLDAIFPMYANWRDNKLLRAKVTDESGSENAGILAYVECAEKISTDTLKQQYVDTFTLKDKLDDKAKTNIAGITIAITLIMGASDMLNDISKKYPMPLFQWSTFILLMASIAYLIIAGILSIKVLVAENVVYTINLGSLAGNEDQLRADYDKSTAQNRIQNLIRNNNIYSSYECIRNALICLFIILLISTFPTRVYQNPSSSNSQCIGYSFMYSSETIPNLVRPDVRDYVEQLILNTIADDTSNRTAATIGIIDDTHNLFIKFMYSEDTVTILVVEPYISPS